MKSVLKRFSVCGLVAAVACFSATSAKAQSGSRGGYSAPAMSASPAPSAQGYSSPSYSTPSVATPAYSNSGSSGSSFGSYQPSVSSAPLATGSGCNGPGCAGATATQPSAVVNAYPQYPVFHAQPNYTASYGGYPVSNVGPTHYPRYSQPRTTRYHSRRSFNQCRN